MHESQSKVLVPKQPLYCKICYQFSKIIHKMYIINI